MCASLTQPNQVKNFKSQSRKWLRRVLIIGFWSGVGLFLMIAGCNLWIEWQTRDRLYEEVDKVPFTPVAIVLGVSKYIKNGRLNRYYQHRINAAVNLYQAGKIKHILVSGDNSTMAYNEPVEMQKSLIKRGIPPQAITLDYAGFRTLDSIVRVKVVFSQKKVVVVSQAFHNHRALFIADYYGIQAIGFNAQGIPFSWDMKTPIREFFARFKAVLDLYVLHTQPRFLGKKIEIPLS